MSKKTAAVMAGAFLAMFLAVCGSDQSLIPEGSTPQFPAKPAKINLLAKLPYSSSRIAVLGDCRDGPSSFEDITDDIVNMKPQPELVAHLGDMISDAGSGIEWYDFQKQAKPLAGRYPFYPIPGNHDVTDQSSEEIYRNQFPAPINNLYYEVEFKDLLLIFLDSEITGEHGEITGQQFDWLKNLLAQKGANFRYRVVFVHRPLFPSAEHVGDSLDGNPAARDRLHKLFVSSGVNLVFVAHEHIYDRKKIGGVTYVTTGGAGAPLPDDPKAFFNFVFLAETGRGLQGYDFSIGGVLKDQFLIK